MNRWHVVQFERGKHKSAENEIVCSGFLAYTPMIVRRRVIHGQVSDLTVPRFGCYLFANFDRDIPGWQLLTSLGSKRAGIVRILGNDPSRPIPVPDEAIDAIRAYEPTPVEEPRPYLYSPGEPCTIHIGGRKQQAVFVSYQGKRQFVRAWIFGAEHVVEAKAADLEPLDIDNTKPSAPISAA